MIDDWLAKNLICPVDGLPLQCEGRFLVSGTGRRYPVVDGIPVMIVEDVDQTHEVALSSLRLAMSGDIDPLRWDPRLADTLGISELQRVDLRRQMSEWDGSGVDPVISMLVGATSGYAYE